MAVLTVYDVDEDGQVNALTAAASGGDTASNDGDVILFIKNAHAADPRTITVTPQDVSRTIPGLGVMTKASAAVTITAAQDYAFIGPFPVDAFNDTSGRIVITYSDSAADLTIMALRVAKI